ncbi:LutC/YkgG family protein [Heliophilum fasciatum]|uniref:LutC/YkgG family protein n=1 Tax=Heliophilum fasciatum TaxID=35700 RepID=UPI001404EDDA|nr:lactate utilization protein [Heliophilum fasciatum]MCW2277387.1 L-lactate dehydrogenase complex protein LldG [Heliophilum fasciatum]
MSADRLYDEFKKRAEAVGANVFRVATYAAAMDVVATYVQETGAKRVHIAPHEELEKMQWRERLSPKGVHLSTELNRQELAQADIGLSFLSYAVAETGSVLSATESPLARAVSMLPPTHIAVVPAAGILPTVGDALQALYTAEDSLPGYISFISGPSRTADIERVLTIGVHGPSRLLVICVDEAEVK